MTRDRLHKCLAIAGAVLAIAVFAAANVHLITVAYRSQPACITPAAGHAPASPGC